MSGASGVELLSIIRSSLDPSGYVAGARQIEAASDRVVASGDKVASGQEKITRGMDRAAKSFTDWLQKVDPAAKAAADFADAQARADNVLRLGLITQEQHANAIAKAQQQYERASGAMAKTQASLRQVAETQAVVAREAEAAANRFAAAQARMAEASAAAQNRQSAEINRLESRFRPLILVNERYRQELADVSKAERAGIINAQEAARERDRLADAYAKQRAALRGAGTDLVPVANAQKNVAAGAKDVTNAFGVTARQAQQLAPQINDVVTGLLSGQDAFMILAQQGGQITQAMGGVGNTFRAVAALFTPFRIGVLAVGGALVGTFAAYEGTERRLATLRNQLRGYSADYEAVARTIDRSARSQAQTLPGVSGADVRSTQGRLAQIVRPEDRGNIEQYTALIVDLSRTLDKDLAGATERVATMIQRPAEAARNLAENGVRGFDERFRRHIELLELAGNRSQATAEVIGRAAAVFGGAARDMSPLERVLDNASKSFERLKNEMVDWLNRAANPFVNWLERVQQRPSAGESFIGALLQQVPPEQRAAAERDLRAQMGWAGGGGTGATNVTPSPAAANPLVAEAARITGLDPELLGRVHRAEGAQNPDGSWRTSAAGARGPMQVMPGTFDDVSRRYGIQGGIDDPRANMLAGAYYLRERLQSRGDVALALADYNAGPGRVDRVLGGQAQLPDETSRYVRTIREGYTGTGLAAAPSAATTTRPGIGSDAGATGIRELSAQEAGYQRTLADARNRGTPIGERQQLEARLSRYQNALSQAPAGSNEYRELQQAIEGVNAALTGLERPIDQTLRGMRDQNRVMQEQEGFTRELAQARLNLEEAARAQGRAPTPAEYDEVRQQILQRAVAGYRDLTANVDRQIAAEERLAQSYMQGNAAAQETEARNRAIEEARRLNIIGTEQEAIVVADLTQKYLRLNAAQNGRTIAARLPEQQQQLELLRQQNATIGLSQADQARALAEINARAYVNRDAAGTSETPAGQQYIANAINAANLQENARSLKEIEGYGREAAGVLVDGFRAFAIEGQKSSDVLRSMERALLDLGTRALILKPLEEALGRLSTMAFGGGGQGGAGGLLGSLGSLFGSGGAEAGVGAAVGGLKGTAEAAMAAGTLVSIAHEGGLVGNDNLPQRFVPSSLHRGAPRFHTGGGYLARTEFPAILEYGERVLTGRQQRAVGAAVTAPRGQTIYAPVTIRTEDPGSFGRTKNQIAQGQRRALGRAARNS